MVTGASSGIGGGPPPPRARCPGARAGSHWSARRKDRLDSLAEAIRERGRHRAGAGVRHHRRATGHRRGGAEPSPSSAGWTPWVNNAGRDAAGPRGRLPPLPEWQRMVELKRAGACLYCAHAALPPPAEGRRGRPLAGWAEHGQHQLGGRPGFARGSGRGRLQPDQSTASALFSEALRQEGHPPATCASRWSSPGAVADPSWAGHNRPEVIEVMRGQFADTEPMQPGDIADAIVYNRDPAPGTSRSTMMLVRPTEQE